jgi:DNA-binding response OmpR family regulator
MVSGNIKVLVLEDNSTDIALIQQMLKGTVSFKRKKYMFENDFCRTLDEAKEYLKSNYVDVVLLDLNLPDSRGLDTFQNFHKSFPDVPIIILSGFGDENLSLHALQEGARDYLIKGEFNDKSLVNAILGALEEISYDHSEFA